MKNRFQNVNVIAFGENIKNDHLENISHSNDITHCYL